MTTVGKVVRRGWALFALPTALCFAVFFVVPLAMGIYLSFTSFRTVTDAKWVGLKNYVDALSDPEFGAALWRSVLFTIVTTIIINVVSFLLAYMFTKAMRGANLFRSVFFMPTLIGGIVLGYIWQLLLNGVLALWDRSLTTSAVYGFWGMVILMCWQQIGYMMVIYIAGFQSLPTDLIEAAQVDGASNGQIMRRIIIPLMMPSVTVCSFLTVANGFKMFDQNLSLTGGDPGKQSQLLALNIYDTFYARSGPQWKGIGQAKAVVFFVLVVVIALIQLRATSSKEVQQ